jgi:hypothetical protein
MKKKETAASARADAAADAVAAANKAPPTGNSPGSALPLGAVAKIPIIPGYGPGPRIGDIQLSLLEVLRDKEAAALVQSRRIQAAPLKTGFENVLLHIKAGYVRRGKDAREQTYKMSEGQFVAYSADGGTEYQVLPVSEQPGENLIGHTFAPGESREGWLLCQLPQKEKKPFLVFSRGNVENVWGLWSDVWFQIFS